MNYKYILALLVLFFSFSCKKPYQKNLIASQIAISDTISEYDLIVGAERIAKYHPRLVGKKVACVVNHTSFIGEIHLVDSLISLEVNITKLFSPEHGLRGKADAGEKINDGIDDVTNLPVVSLYGNHKKPTPDDLKDIDIVVFDLQDVGVRFYTYISTLTYVMEACAELKIPIIVLDRPNINRHYVDGPVLKKEFESFVGMHPVPVVYGMTIGEYALMVNGEGWLKDNLKCDLTIIECIQHENVAYYEFPVPPSPNLPNTSAMYLYPSICFFEPTIVSVGRGTDLQFRQIGYPDYHNKDYQFTPKPNVGSKDPKYNGETCYGLNLSNLTTSELIKIGKIDLTYILDMYNQSNKKDKFFTNAAFFDKLAGTDQLRKQIVAGVSEQEIKKSWASDLIAYLKIREKYLLY